MLFNSRTSFSFCRCIIFHIQEIAVCISLRIILSDDHKSVLLPTETMFKEYQNTPNGGDFTFRFISDKRRACGHVDTDSGMGLYSITLPVC